MPTHFFVDNIAFEDMSGLPFIGMKRTFQSFNQGVQEASMNHECGSMHYRTGTDASAVQGWRVGKVVVQLLAAVMVALKK